MELFKSMLLQTLREVLAQLKVRKRNWKLNNHEYTNDDSCDVDSYLYSVENVKARTYE